MRRHEMVCAFSCLRVASLNERQTNKATQQKANVRQRLCRLNLSYEAAVYDSRGGISGRILH